MTTEQVMTWLSLVVTRSSSSYEGCYWLRPISHRTVLALGLALVRPDHDRTYVVRTYYHHTLASALPESLPVYLYAAAAANRDCSSRSISRTICGVKNSFRIFR